MTIRRLMQTTASRARANLAERAAVIAFLHRQRCPDGGWPGRSPHSDPYFTMFAVESLAALDAEFNPPTLAHYLLSSVPRASRPRSSVPRSSVPRASSPRSYVPRASCPRPLDQVGLVELASRARCLATLRDADPTLEPPGLRDALARRLRDFATPDGGFHVRPGAQGASAYGAFVGLGALEDLELDPPDPDRLADALEPLALPDGGFANEPSAPTGLTAATAAAVVVLARLDRPIPPQTVNWLRQRCLPTGGFTALPAIFFADLLSTATALFALQQANADLADLAGPCADYLGRLWDHAGAWHAHQLDNRLDCEYCFYGLLASGSLA